MALLTSTRVLKASAARTMPMTDELYNEMSVAHQFTAKLAEASEVEVKIGEYEGRYFVHRDTIEALDAKLFKPVAATVTS